MATRSAVHTGGALLFALAACTDLPALQADVCGNAVIEAGEDCDTFAPAGMRCTGPEEPSPCRFSCHAALDGGAPRCPEHWGCGLDGICRQASGGFAPVGEPIAAGAFSAITGDFDGDGRQDVLTRGPPNLIDQGNGRVHYFDGSAALAASRVLLEPMVSPVVADVDGDGCDDLICGVGVGGLLTWRGTRDRQLFPVPAPFFQTGTRDTRLIPVEPPYGDTRYLVLTAAGGRTVLALPGAELAPLVDLGDETRYAAFAGEPARGVFVDQDAEACAGFALAFPGDLKVTVYSPCRQDAAGEVDWAADLAPVHVILGEPVRGVFAADVNGDGHLDLLIAVRSAVTDAQGQTSQEDRVRVAYGDGTGHFASSPELLASPDGKASPQPWALPVLQNTGLVEVVPIEQLPLAAGQLTDDGTLDFVFPTEILVSLLLSGAKSGFFYVEAGDALHGAWTQAAIVDLNGNGLPDVIAASAGSFDLDFYNGTGTYQLLASTLPTSGKVSQFVVGDLDGDLTQDVLFAQPADDASGRDELFVSFGQPGEQPLAPVKVGESEPIRSMAATGQSTLMPPVALLTTPASSSVATVSLLLGSTSRQPFAPSFLTRSLPSAADAPVALTAGPLGGPGTLQVFALAFDFASAGTDIPPLASWAADALSSQVGTSAELATPVFFAKGEWPALVAQGDLDGDGETEVAILSAASGVDIWAGADSPSGGRLRIGHLRSSGAGLGWEPQATVELPMLTPVAGGRLALVDLDGDGFPEVVIASGTESVAVLWNDGQGGLDAGALSLLEDGARMFATIHDRPGAPPSLVYVTRDAVKRVRATGHGALGSPEVLLGDLRDGTGLAAGDVDGDGIEDLAVVDDQNLRILRGQAVLP